jgi:hypothetical protein
MAGAPKPLDIGTGLVCASFVPSTAAWLSIGRPHPAVGFVELADVPPFDERLRGDADATRRHRTSMTDPGHAFLRIEADGSEPQLTPDLRDPTRIHWHGDGLEVEAAPATDDPAEIVQTWRASDRQLRLVVRGHLDRPALAEVTETDPVPPTGAVTTWTADAASLVADAPTLPQTAIVRVTGRPVRWTVEAADAVGLVEPGEQAVEVRVRLGTAIGAGQPPAPPTFGDGLVDRALAYVRGCTALATSVDERVILTDHRLLPLSWTRDAYWQAVALLAADAPGDRERVADHLRWLWRRCERPEGRWARSHHADGRRKDLGFQADQQLYPLIELADLWRLSGRLPSGVGWDAAVSGAWSAVLEALDPVTRLLATSETAADDPAEAPFIGATQILLWYAATRLAELVDADAIGRPDPDPASLAATARAAFARSYERGSDAWPYAVDGRGGQVRYHDANDLPVAMAPVWGFCAADDPGWRATMAAAFDPRNPGWSAGRLAGLGSIHTAGTWTLGDIQAWLHARASGDEVAMRAARERLEQVAYADGMLPEAYGPEPEQRVRPWFAWPGAALSALIQLDASGELEWRLGVRTSR